MRAMPLQRACGFITVAVLTLLLFGCDERHNAQPNNSREAEQTSNSSENQDAETNPEVAGDPVGGEAGGVVAFANDLNPSFVCWVELNADIVCQDVDPRGFASNVVLGDLNGDDVLDAVFAHIAPAASQICYGRKDAGFSQCEDFSPMSIAGGFSAVFTQAAALGDVDGDGDIDLILANNGTVSDEPNMTLPNHACLNDGRGKFECQEVDTPRHAKDVALGDFDEDGWLDAVFAIEEGRTRLCWGIGDGTFLCEDFPQQAEDNTGLAVADIDADGHLDIALAQANGNNAICWGDGTGDFTCRVFTDASGDGQAVALGDMNGDGRMDVVLALIPGDEVCLATEPRRFRCTPVNNEKDGDLGWSLDVALGDLNADGHLDAAFFNSFQENMICLGNGTGSLDCKAVPKESTTSLRGGVAIASVGLPPELPRSALAGGGTAISQDRDQASESSVVITLPAGKGALDLVFSRGHEDSAVCLAPDWDCQYMELEGAVHSALALGDVNEDGYLDVVFASFALEHPVCLGNGEAVPFASARCSNIVFNLEEDTPAAAIQDMALGDVDADGHLDIIYALLNNPNQLCFGDGTGAFNCQGSREASNFSMSVAVGDINDDGHLDAVFGNMMGNLVCLGNSTRTPFDPDRCETVGIGMFGLLTNSMGVELGDFDQDGNLDALFATAQENEICLGDGTGAMTCRQLGGSYFSQAVGVGDFNEDGRPDAIFANNQTEESPNNHNRYCLGQARGVFRCSEMDIGAYNTNNVAVGDINDDGHLDAVFANSGEAQDQLCFGDGTGAFACQFIGRAEDITFGVAIGKIKSESEQ